jgi:hypothetical protein
MSTRTRIRLYKGIIEAEAEARFRADAVWAVREGWYPTEWRWDGTAMRVVYSLVEHEPWVEPLGRHIERRRVLRQLSHLAPHRRERT